MLTRMTALAVLAAAGLFALFASSRRRLGPLLVWIATIAAGVRPVGVGDAS